MATWVLKISVAVTAGRAVSGGRPAVIIAQSFMRRVTGGWAFVSYLLITIVLAFPLVRGLATRLPNDPVDPVLNAWILWWNTQAFPFTERWWSPPVFFPATDTLTYSEHLFGLSPLSTPVYWLTGSPVVAYNVAFLLTFALSGLTAYWLGVELTGRRDAGWVAGLAFAFAPYRMDQLAHIQVLASFWMPVAMLGLHRYYRDGHTRWLALFAGATAMQGLTNGYYLLFFPVLVALWVLWFTPNEGWWRKVGAVGVSGALASLLVLPILLKYRAVHESLGLARSLREIEGYSADLIGFVSASSHLSVWSVLDGFHSPEGQLFPGLTVAALFAAVLWRVQWWPPGREPLALRVVRAVVTTAAILFVIGLVARAFGPWELRPFGWKVAINRVDQAIPQAVLASVVALVLSPAGAWAYRRHSPFPFYLLAAFLLAVLSMGPHPSVMGTSVMTHSPYLGLMQLPGFDGLRVPARFWMLALVCVSAAAALAYARLVPSESRRPRAALAVVTLALLADGWVAFPTVPAPRRSTMLEDRADGPVLELPLGWRNDDVAAMLRSVYHGQSVVNGHSSYLPPHYGALSYGLDRGRSASLTALGALGVRHIRIDRDNPTASRYERLVATTPELRLVAETSTEALYEFRAPPAMPATRRVGPALPVAGLSANVNDHLTTNALDGDLGTRWDTGPQYLGQTLTIDLGALRQVGALVLALGQYRMDFPRVLVIECSSDGTVWERVWGGPTDVEAMVAALRDLDAVPMMFSFDARSARYLRLRQMEDDGEFYWSVAELSVRAPAR